MHKQLHLLVELQDLDSLIRDAEDPENQAAFKKMGLSMENLEALYAARTKLATRIEARYLRTYERVRKKYKRAVVPVENRTCLGCFQAVPPSFFSEITADRQVKLCENCGRILYLLTD